MTTECTQFVFGFHPQKRREIRAQFDGASETSHTKQKPDQLHNFSARNYFAAPHSNKVYSSSAKL